MSLINSINHQKPFDLLSHLNEHYLVVYFCIGKHEFLVLLVTVSWKVFDCVM